jgi:CubicO group peptidase (beta-lactamase class C family)
MNESAVDRIPSAENLAAPSGAIASTTAVVDTDPADAGFDSARLDRIGALICSYVDDGRLPGGAFALRRGGKTVYTFLHGHRDIENNLPVELDTVFRIYSMTKPITSVAAMMLFEENKLDINDPVAKYVPAFANTRVYERGPANNPGTVPQTHPMTIFNLLTHTSGLTYGFAHANGIDHLYRQAGFEWGTPKGMDLQACCEVWAGMPLLFQPGEEWNYSVSTDVLGRVVEVASGMSLDTFIEERITKPLGMNETSFWANDSQADRFAALYVPGPKPERKAVRMDALGIRGTAQPMFLSGGGGLVSTLGDYLTFCEMLRRGGELHGTRLLSNRTLRFMTQNHLPGGNDLSQVGRPLFSETNNEGTGFGLGFSVVTDPVKSRSLCSKGEFAWGGAASTAFWVDPVEDLTAVFMTQLLPSSSWPIRNELRRAVYQSLVD